MSGDDLIRVLLVDDHPVVRDGLRALLETVGSMESVGEASTGAEAIEAAVYLQPDVVVMDLSLPDLDGTEATRRITQRSPHVRVLVLTMHDDDDSVFAAMRAGATGYLLKGAEPADVVRAIDAVSRGEAIFGPGVAGRVTAYFKEAGVAKPAAFPELTDREREVLELLARGSLNPAIAKELDIRLKTVRNHVSNVLTKLAVADRVEAALRAREAGMGHISRDGRDRSS